MTHPKETSMTPRTQWSAALFLSLTAVAATGFAYNSSMSTSQATPYTTPAVTTSAAVPIAEEPAIAPPSDDTIPPAAPERAALEHYSLPAVTVTAPRPSDDELLRNAVLDRLASDSRLSGQVGVEAYRHTVSLTGRVLNTMQIDRAETIVRGVDGVWDVNNYLNARVGRS
jgi:hypothetical protein